MGHFSAALRSYSREGLHSKGHPLSRSYGVNLPRSLTTVLPSALGYSPHPPVSVLVRIPESLPRGFSRRSVRSLRQKGSTSPPGLRLRIFLQATLGLIRASDSTMTFPSVSPHR